MTPEEIFRIIGSEIQSNTLVASTWTQAFAEADGDDAKAKARYIRMRQAQLQAAALERAAASDPPPPTSQSAPRLPPRTEIEIKRELLAARLAAGGKPSLYSQLDVSPAADATTLKAAIDSLREAEMQGRILSAEDRYAIQTLGDPPQRERYDRKLLESLASMEGRVVSSASIPEREALGKPIRIAAGVVIIAVLAYVMLGFYQEKSRKEVANAALKVQEAAVQAAAEAQAIRAAQMAEEAEQAAQLAAQQNGLRQQLADDQVRARSAQIELQREQLDERKRQAAWSREQTERQRELRAEQEKSRRVVYEAERDLCIAGRRNNNSGEIARWCK